MLAQVAEIFLAFLRLGLTSFGGPVAHLGYFRREFVEHRKWLDEHAYADLVSLCQVLPGPASSQVGIALGLKRGGIPGSLAAWLGFTLPSAIALVAFGLLLSRIPASTNAAWLHGLKLVAVAVVAQAVWNMGRRLCPDRERASIAVLGCASSLLIPGTTGQLLVIAAGAAVGLLWLRAKEQMPPSPFAVGLSRHAGAGMLAAFALLLLVLPLASASHVDPALGLFDRFFRAGALVFGGGHVVLPMLQAEMVPTGRVDNDVFLAGYGAAQAVPGPLFTFAAFLGTVANAPPNGLAGALIALIGIFLPGYLLIVGALPLWDRARSTLAVARSMVGVNAAVVGLLLAAFYNPVWISAVHSAADVCVAILALLLLEAWKVAPWIVVALCCAVAALGSV